MKLSVFAVLLVAAIHTTAQVPVTPNRRQAVVASAQQADAVILNGKIYTGIGEHPWAKAVAIRNGRFEAVGTDAEIAPLAGPQTEQIDAGKRLIVPGFNDAHIHFGTKLRADVVGFGPAPDPSCEAVLAAAREYLSKGLSKRLLIVTVGGSAFFDSECTKSTLDLIAPDRPLMLKTWTPHAAILNSSAAAELGVNRAQVPVAGGWFGKDMNVRKWDGVVHEYAAFDLYNRAAEYDEKELRQFLDNAARFGITSLQIMSWDPARLLELLSLVHPTIRIRIISYLLPRDGTRPAFRPINVPENLRGRVTFSGVKWVLDGTPIERSSAMRSPYIDAPNTSGRLNFSPAEMKSILREALAINQQPILHATGDRAVETLLAALEHTGGASVWSKRRVRIEHGEGLMPDLVTRARKLGVVLVQNPSHLNLERLYAQRFGPDFTKNYGPLRSVLTAGIALALGSDGPMDPFLNLALATTYERRPQEALTVEQALLAYTRTAAYAEFEEKQKGTIAVGKYADFAILSDDVFSVAPNRLVTVRALLTVVGGIAVHRAPPFSK